ncbi:MAG: dTDP-4-dehydrorhamnose 3,5-epimerase [Verrucomicrobiales bacterium VVV1]|nr:MAG: dTDP-4-dehydrorhamnose 3,5-epimerase [Verrucomicrobiales bacterium VVV1]
MSSPNLHSTGQTSLFRNFVDAPIEGILVKPLPVHEDSRGWLMELYREDQAGDEPLPAMAYASMTLPGISRGPHEHAQQTDRFCFFGPSDFLIVLWDNRPSSPTFNNRMKLIVGQTSPSLIVVPHGVVHGYRNIGSDSGLILNLPDRLYMGPQRQEDVDEIRHELDPESPFHLDD